MTSQVPSTSMRKNVSSPDPTMPPVPTTARMAEASGGYQRNSRWLRPRSLLAPKLEVVAAHGPGVEEALDDEALLTVQKLFFRLVLDAFGHDVEAQAPCERHDGAGDGGSFRRGRQSAHELPIDLE